MDRLDKKDCPIFEDDAYEEILNWADATVIWAEETVGTNDEVSKLPEEWCCWAFYWQFGYISFLNLRDKENEVAARKAAALFIYLWCNGIGCSLAERCAEAYVK